MTIDLRLHADFSEVTIRQADGTVEEKIIDNTELKKLISAGEEVTQTLPILPGEYGVQKIETQGNRTGIAYLEPPTKRRITLSGRSYTIVTPRLLWVFTLRYTRDRYDVMSSRVYSVKGPILNGDEPLYAAPLGNVFSGRHSICWGGVRLNVPTLKSLQGIPSLFFRSPFNTDLDTGNILEVDSLYTFTGLVQKQHRMLQEGVSEEDALELMHTHLLPTRTTLNALSII